MQLKVFLCGLFLATSGCKQTADELQYTAVVEPKVQLAEQAELDKTWKYRTIVQGKNQKIDVWAVYDLGAAYAQPAGQLVIHRDSTGVMRVEIVAENVHFHCDRSYCPINVSFAGKNYIFYIDTALSTAIEQSKVVLNLGEVDIFLELLRESELVEIKADFFPETLPKLIFNTQLSSEIKSF